MREFILLFALLTLAGCGDGNQRGRFSAAGERSLSLSSHTGCISIVDGYALTPDSQIAGPRQNLIYLVVVCPGLVSHGSGSNSKHDVYLTTLTHAWESKSGSVPVPIRWDRQADTVTAAGREFRREKGNVFVVRRESTTQVTAQQLSSLGPDVDFPAVLRHVREQLPTDELVTSLRTHKLDN